MKRRMKIAAIVGLSLMVVASLSVAQHMDHHDAEPEKEPEKMMPPEMMRWGMMGGRGMMMRGGMRGPGMRHRMHGGMMGAKGDVVGQLLHRIGGPGFYERHAEELGLSDEQKAQFKEIWSSHHKDMIRTRADIEIAQVELKELLTKDSPEFDRAKKKVSQISKMRGEIAQERLEALQKARKVLAAEQIEKLKSLKEGMTCDPRCGMPMGGRGGMMHRGKGRR